MRKLEWEEGKKVVLDTDMDHLVWSGRKNRSKQNTPTRWLNLYVHECPPDCIDEMTGAVKGMKCSLCGGTDIRAKNHTAYCSFCGTELEWPKPLMICYLAHYTCRDGEKSYIEKLPLDQARRFAEEHYAELNYDDEALRYWGLIVLDQVK
jgi:hypothetical protein